MSFCLLSVIGSSISRPFFSSNKTSLKSFSRPYKNFFTKLPLKKSLWLRQWTLSTQTYQRYIPRQIITYINETKKSRLSCLLIHYHCTLVVPRIIYFEGGGHYISWRFFWFFNVKKLKMVTAQCHKQEMIKSNVFRFFISKTIILILKLKPCSLKYSNVFPFYKPPQPSPTFLNLWFSEPLRS